MLGPHMSMSMLGPHMLVQKCKGCVTLTPHLPSSLPLYESRSLRKPTGRRPEGEESGPLNLLYSVHRAVHGVYGAKATELLPSQHAESVPDTEVRVRGFSKSSLYISTHCRPLKEVTLLLFLY